METENRAQFATKMGVIATTVGSAVGLGNIWRFPYEAGVHGGGAFLLCYVGFILLIGVPVICAEFVMGRSTRRNIFGAFRLLSGNKALSGIGYMSVLCSILILSFYSVVAGWTVGYFVNSIAQLLSIGSVRVVSNHEFFTDFSTGWQSVAWTVFFLFCNAAVLLRGVQKGIEKVSNILMPLLFVILLLLCVNSLMLNNASEGLKFMFVPDFSAINSSVLIGAMGQAFFSLSLGLGTMMIYASYFSAKTPLVKSAITTASLDTLVAVLSGIVIFPAVFTFGTEPSAGPVLVFEVLPSIFSQMTGGAFWSVSFFFLLMVASLTSTISMSEICVAFFSEQYGLSRRKAVLLNTLIAMTLGVMCALSFGVLGDVKVAGLTVFNLFDYLSSNIMLPLGGLAISLFVGWRLNRNILEKQLGRVPGFIKTALLVSLRYIAPVGIALVFLSGF